MSRADFEAAFRPLQPNWTFEDDGCGGYHHGSTDWAWQGWQARAALKAAQPVPRLVMADGSPLLDYLNVPPDSPQTDEWTAGYHEARRRLYKILAPQLAPAPQEPAEPVAVGLPEVPAPDLGSIRLHNGKEQQLGHSDDAMKAFGFQCYARGVMSGKAQSVADAQDAMRYRWLRDHGQPFIELGGVKHEAGEYGTRLAQVPWALDAAIDAAMALDVTKRDPKGD
jgi:hypothetical protein